MSWTKISIILATSVLCVTILLAASIHFEAGAREMARTMKIQITNP